MPTHTKRQETSNDEVRARQTRIDTRLPQHQAAVIIEIQIAQLLLLVARRHHSLMDGVQVRQVHHLEVVDVTPQHDLAVHVVATHHHILKLLEGVGVAEHEQVDFANESLLAPQSLDRLDVVLEIGEVQIGNVWRVVHGRG